MGKTIIIGGVAGGASAAARLRRLNEEEEIILFEKGEYISFANCGLPYYIGGVIKERDALLIQTPKTMMDRFHIDIRIQSEVVEIRPKNKEVVAKNLVNGTSYIENYDHLVISTGSTPIRPNIEGINSPNIFSLWNIPDTDAIKQFVTQKEVKTATVIGGGFIGIEMAENLSELGIDVSLVEMQNQVMTQLDYDMAQLVHANLVNNGMKLYLENGVKKFVYNQNVNTTSVMLQDGTAIESDIVILSIGIRPNSKLAESAGITTNQKGGILVDENLRTNIKNVYAIGDVIEVIDVISEEKTMIPLAGPANKQGRIVADNIAGIPSIYEGSIGTSVAKVFDMTVSSTGNSEKALQKRGLALHKDYEIAILSPKAHAGYYPEAMPMTLKVMFDKKGKIYGAQGVGFDGVEKRIDVIATTMKLKGTIYDLGKLELAYAPPFSSAKDPVNMAGFIGENILSGKMQPITVKEIKEQKEATIVDVRTEVERSLGAIDGSIHIELDKLREKAQELDPKREYIVYCAVGLRGYLATRILEGMGYKVKNLIGGYNMYKAYYRDFTTNKEYCATKGDEPVKDVKVNHNIQEEIKEEEYLHLDACGLQCPGPIMKLKEKVDTMTAGQVVRVEATDPGFIPDAKSWSEKTGNKFLDGNKDGKKFIVLVKKGGSDYTKPKTALTKEASTMVVFSNDLDKVLASFIIANGAAAMGREVTMFFTFWGLNVLRKEEKVQVKKGIIDKMFGFMMPRGSKKLSLSQMNMMGMGTKMMKKVMKEKNVNSLEELMESAMKNGVKIAACTMSMDIMGIKKEELIEGIEYVGVASYMGDSADASHTLFI